MNRKDRVRVLQVVNVAHVTTKGFFLPLAHRLREQGYDVTLAAGSVESPEVFMAEGFDVECFPMERRLLAATHARTIWKLYALMRRERFHVVHTHTLLASLLARIAAGLAGVPVVIYHVRGTYSNRGTAVHRLYLMLERVLARLNTFVFTLNESGEAEFLRHGIAEEENVHCQRVGGTGIDVASFSPSRMSKAKVEAKVDTHRHELGLEREHQVVCFVGRMVREKGILDLLEAFRIIARESPSARLLMVGGVLESERDQHTFRTFKKRADEAGLSDRIVCTGFREDVPELLMLADVLVQPSYREGFGMTIAEAAVMGREAREQSACLREAECSTSKWLSISA